jgi:signal transduction histidine kinase
MKRPWLSGGMNPLAIAGLAGALLLLAVLQYRWIGEMAEADRERLRRGAEASARQFRDDFNRELLRLARTFDVGNDALLRHDWQRFADALGAWRAVGGGYLEVEDLFLRESTGRGESRVLRLTPEGWAPEMGETPPLLERGGPRGRGGPGGGFRGGFGRPGAVFVPDGPGLVFGLVALEHRAGERPRPDYVGTLAITLRPESFTEGLLPALALRYFGASEDSVYDVAVLDRGEPSGPKLIYATRDGLSAASFRGSEVELPMIWRREEAMDPARVRGPGRRPPEGRDGFGSGELDISDFLFDSIAPAGPGNEWVILVKAAEGSLDAVVERLRRRNLGISLGILALLAAGMAVLLVSTRRAERLARLQMEFVAGVSHELRTPLAVIRSAGDNLAEGVVKAPEQVRDYGKLIRDEGRRLTGMVEQTLQFASTQAGRQQYKLESAPPGEIVKRAVADLRPAIEEAGFTLEEQYEQGLSAVRVDVAAASRVIQSLVENALKYGGDSKWVGIETAARNGSVEVTVRDRGVGIDAEDMPNIFDPFYRGKRATDAQIHGTGLGLALARSAAEGFGGDLRAESTPGQGSAFTLRIPRAERD